MPTVHDDLAQVVSLHVWGSRRHQAARRRVVRDSLRDADYWIVAGLTGAVSLEVAVAEASCALSPAIQETCRAALS